MLAFSVRLILLPWSQTVHADAVSRVFIAVNWLDNPHYISDGYWGPLHHYLNALFIWLFRSWIVGPKMLNILLASLTVFPLYGFTKNVFRTSMGAVFVSLVYVFSPIVLRNSFQALAGVSYAFFTVSSMYFLSEGFRREGNYRYAAFAGLCMTFAAATRYEAWVVIAAFTLVGVLSGKWKFTFVFWLFAMIFPGSWMVGNQIQFGDFLYSVNQNDVWNIKMEGINDSVSSVERIQRVLFFPISFIQNVSPLTFFLLLFGLAWAVLKRKITRMQLVWLLPFIIMAAIYMQKAFAGTLMQQQRFIITWIILLLPFLALAFVHEKQMRLKATLMSISVLTLIPLSFCWMYIPYEKLFGDGNLPKALDHLALTTSQEMEAVPLLRSSDTEYLTSTIDSTLKPGQGLVLDFFGWDRTYYTALHAHVRSCVIEGSKHAQVEFGLLDGYIRSHPSGLIALSRVGRLNESTLSYDTIIGWKEINLWLRVQPVAKVAGVRLFDYEMVDQAIDEPDSLGQAVSGVFPQELDEEYFEVVIRSDNAWYNKLRRASYWKGESLENAVHENAEYMVWLENQQK